VPVAYKKALMSRAFLFYSDLDDFSMNFQPPIIEEVFACRIVEMDGVGDAGIEGVDSAQDLQGLIALTPAAASLTISSAVRPTMVQ